MYDMLNVVDEWTQYMYEDLRLIVCVSDADGLSNAEMINSKKGVIKGVASAEWFDELLSEKTTKISGIDAIEILSTADVNGTAYNANCIIFIHNSKMYFFLWMVEADSDTDYSKDYQSFKEKISLKGSEQETEIIKESTYVFSNKNEKISYSLSKDKDNKFYYSVSGSFDDEWKAAVVYKITQKMFDNEKLIELNCTLSVNIWCGTIFMSEKGVYDIASGESIDFEKWYEEKVEECDFAEVTKFSAELYESIEGF